MQKDLSVGKTDVLVIVDVQNDFCPGGAFPVPEGDQVIPVINEYITLFEKAQASILATRDWHPPNHISFKAQGGPWPPHCIQNTEGAKFHLALKLPKHTVVVSKAMSPLKENYSAFEGTELSNTLKKQGIKRIFVSGLATEYCVKHTVLDALSHDFESVLLTDAIAGINAEPEAAVKAIAEMIESGAEKATMIDFLYPSELPPANDPETEHLVEKPLSKFENKKKARMRPRGPYKKIRAERG